MQHQKLEADFVPDLLTICLYAPKGFADTYLDIYCKKAKKTQAAILKWLPVIAGARCPRRMKRKESNYYNG